jgi:hypothetical protein
MLLPLYTKILENCSVGDMDNTKVMTEVMHNTGGFNISLEGGSKVSQERCLGIIFRIKMLNEDINNGIDLTKRIIKESKIDDYKAIWNSLVDMKNMYKSVASSAGYRFATIAASSDYSDNAKIIEQLLGITQWTFLKSIKREDVANLAKELNELKNKINNLNRFEIHLTCEEEKTDECKKTIEKFLNSFEATSLVVNNKKYENFENVKGKKGYILPSSVNHTSYVIPAKPLGSKENSVQRILSSILSGNDLWNEIRVLGGAYGVDCHVESLERLFIFISASDPNLSKTFEVFKKTLEKYSKDLVDKSLIDDAIISNVANDLKPYGPDRKSIIDFRRILYNIEDEVRRNSRKEILNVNSVDIQNEAKSLSEETNYSYAFFCDKNTFDKEKDILDMDEDKLVYLSI